MNNIKTLLLTSRPISWINTAYPFAAGYILVTRRFDRTLLIGTLFYLIPYNLLMYGVNDVYDYESDLKNPRKGGVEGAKLQKPKHRMVLWAAYVLAVPFMVYLILVTHKPYGLLVLVLNVFLVLAYSLPKLRFKERAFIDSLTSSSHFVGPLLVALSFATFRPAMIGIIVAFFLWGMASHAFGAVQDIVSDKAAHIGSVATVIGAKATVRLSILLYVLSAIVLISYGWLGMIVALTEISYIINIWPYRWVSDSKAEKANGGWRRFLKINQCSGFIITLIVIYLYHLKR